MSEHPHGKSIHLNCSLQRKKCLSDRLRDYMYDVLDELAELRIGKVLWGYMVALCVITVSTFMFQALSFPSINEDNTNAVAEAARYGVQIYVYIVTANSWLTVEVSKWACIICVPAALVCLWISRRRRYESKKYVAMAAAYLGLPAAGFVAYGIGWLLSGIRFWYMRSF